MGKILNYITRYLEKNKIYTFLILFRFALLILVFRVFLINFPELGDNFTDDINLVYNGTLIYIACLVAFMVYTKKWSFYVYRAFLLLIVPIFFFVALSFYGTECVAETDGLGCVNLLFIIAIFAFANFYFVYWLDCGENAMEVKINE